MIVACLLQWLTKSILRAAGRKPMQEIQLPGKPVSGPLTSIRPCGQHEFNTDMRTRCGFAAEAVAVRRALGDSTPVRGGCLRPHIAGSGRSRRGVSEDDTDAIVDHSGMRQQ